MSGGLLAVANHYESPSLRACNGEDSSDSRTRQKCARKAARRFAGTAKDDMGKCRLGARQLLRILSHEPVLNDLTAQVMAFIPARGAYAFRYRDTDAAVLRYLEE